MGLTLNLWVAHDFVCFQFLNFYNLKFPTWAWRFIVRRVWRFTWRRFTLVQIHFGVTRKWRHTNYTWRGNVSHYCSTILMRTKFTSFIVFHTIFKVFTEAVLINSLWKYCFSSNIEHFASFNYRIFSVSKSSYRGDKENRVAGGDPLTSHDIRKLIIRENTSPCPFATRKQMRLWVSERETR